jgi:two-component system sensor histidine kinase FlrB
MQALLSLQCGESPRFYNRSIRARQGGDVPVHPLSDTEPGGQLDRAGLEEAFSLFTEASKQLVESYQELERKVESLTQELALANGALRQQFEEKAALSRRLETLLAALPGGVVELNVDGVVVAVNPAAISIFGTSLVSMSWSEAVAENLVPTAVAGEWDWPVADGGVRRLGVEENQLPSGERILLINDVSESWRLRHQLERHKRLASMGEMAAALAHQLRTPLATAMLYTANMTKASLAERDRIRFGEKSLGRLRYIETLIQNMLQFVRGQQATLEPVNLASVVDEALQTVQPQIEAARRVWRVGEMPEQAWAEASRKEIVGAVINLLENAVQATAPGGAIGVSLARQSSFWRLDVVDDGCGMSAEVKDRLFEPFFTTRTDGTGLGLAIVRNLITAFGGEVDVQSEPGEGARFTILLPAGS